MDMPNEPPGSRFLEKIRAKGYPARDWGGIVWIYMGDPSSMPELPRFEWAGVPGDRRMTSKWLQRSSWVQALEGTIDTSHVSFLHGWLDPASAPTFGVTRREIAAGDPHPKLHVRSTDYGFVYGGRRKVEDGGFYWRVTQWAAPFFALIPTMQWPTNVLACVPVDDHNSFMFSIRYHPERALTAAEREAFRGGGAAVDR
jgi:phenylpropionate dioxygenase-like ring-hydroxylating dioxygenase large terminal subunit